MSNMFSADPTYLAFLLVDLFAIFILVAAMRWVSRLIVKPTSVRSDATNVETAAAVLALIVALTGVTSGAFSVSLLDEWLLVISYGLLAMLLLQIGAWTQDKVILPSFNLKAAIQEGNVCAAILLGAHLLGTAIVIRSAMQWASQDANLGLIAMFFGFAISQCLLALETRLKVLWGKGHLLEAVKNMEMPYVIKAAAQHMGAALAISGSAHFAASMEFQFELAVLAWLVSSVVFLLAYMALSDLCTRIVLPKKGAFETGRPVLEGAVYFGWGLILPALAS